MIEEVPSRLRPPHLSGDGTVDGVEDGVQKEEEGRWIKIGGPAERYVVEAPATRAKIMERIEIWLGDAPAAVARAARGSVRAWDLDLRSSRVKLRHPHPVDIPRRKGDLAAKEPHHQLCHLLWG